MLVIYKIVERSIEHPDDLTAFVVDDSFCLLVPQDGNSEASIVVLIRFEVELTDLFELVRCFGGLSVVEVVGWLALSFVAFTCRPFKNRSVGFRRSV